MHLQEPSHVHWTVDDPKHDEFWQEYLVYTIFKHKATLQGNLQIIHRTTLRLAEQVENSNPNTVRKYVSALCAAPHRILAHGNFSVNTGGDAKHLLQAAIINNETAVVEQILQEPDTPSNILDDARDMWLPPLTLAGRGGNLRMLRALLSTRRFRALAEMREDALMGAVHEGRFEVVAFICDPQWGPMNFVSRQIPRRSFASRTTSRYAYLIALLYRLFHDRLYHTSLAFATRLTLIQLVCVLC
jgi:hypothetical protein